MTFRVTKKDNSNLETASGIEFEFLYMDFHPNFPPRRNVYLANLYFYTMTDNVTPLSERILGVVNIENVQFTYTPGTIENITHNQFLQSIKERFLIDNPNFNLEEVA